MNWKYKLLGLSGLLLSVFLLGRCGGKKSSGPVVLPKNDKEQIIIDPVKHNLIITTAVGTTVTHLPDNRSTFDVHNDGTVKVTSPQLGLELRPFVGYGFADQMRAIMGLDFFYFKSYDIGMMATLPMMKQASPLLGLKVSYNVWSHVQTYIGYDNHKNINAGLSLRF